MVNGKATADGLQHSRDFRTDAWTSANMHVLAVPLPMPTCSRSRGARVRLEARGWIYKMHGMLHKNGRVVRESVRKDRFLDK